MNIDNLIVNLNAAKAYISMVQADLQIMLNRDLEQELIQTKAKLAALEELENQ